jgi:hypothetical protein
MVKDSSLSGKPGPAGKHSAGATNAAEDVHRKGERNTLADVEEKNDRAAHYENTKLGARLRDQGRKTVRERDRRSGEFARGEKRQGDGV